VLGTLAAALFLGLLALGTWQVERRAWKLDLIERVDQRVAAAPVAPPGPADWPGISAAADEYRHVSVAGTFLNDHETQVFASTDLGTGYWVVTPLRTADGTVILVNRGFVPTDRRDPATRPAGQAAGPVTVIGLLRLTEPKGGFLRSNDPAAERWYSRDVAAIAKARDLTDVAPYFVDAEASGADSWPRGGLTVVTFRNSHLVYALTWFALAAMLAIGLARPVLAGHQKRAAAR